MTDHMAPARAAAAKPDLLVALAPYLLGMLASLAIMVVTMLVTIRMAKGPRRDLAETCGIGVSVISIVAIAALALPVVVNG